MGSFLMLDYKIAKEQHKLNAGLSALKKELRTLEESLQPKGIISQLTASQTSKKQSIFELLASAFFGSVGADTINSFIVQPIIQRATHFTTRLGIEKIASKPLGILSKIAGS
jgi:ABC-type molybdenum transport system ATPase subunit/photorepair protein PhrA